MGDIRLVFLYKRLDIHLEKLADHIGQRDIPAFHAFEAGLKRFTLIGLPGSELPARLGHRAGEVLVGGLTAGHRFVRGALKVG